jgi:hypothetical protein
MFVCVTPPEFVAEAGSDDPRHMSKPFGDTLAKASNESLPLILTALRMEIFYVV